MLKSIVTAATAICLAAAPALAEDYTIGHSKGAEDAPITIIEYGSLTCGGCKYFHDKVQPTIEEDYVDTGKVRFIFREVLRNDLDVALVALARCAPEDKFFEITDTIFENQSDILSAASQGKAMEKFVEIGTPYGIDSEDAFNDCYRDMNIRLDIIEVEKSADAYELHGTPTLIVNGEEKYVDDDFRSGETFSAWLDKQMPEASDTPEQQAQ
ncbi:hypothetical protein HY29_11665 [Hyphomonas beringensis]|uniref:Thioredoxin-like fold domain-containing protein n=1 Tax=Hyphomonas beringensis TaxID=1280946 RepID=A0A062U5G1_9PROT|nr:thioredoxin domain-containing protein [Hyphomonas beringensis]KCZ55566.1 hypothetical protein HY29_11665 [Hyphomonas beringensis]